MGRKINWDVWEDNLADAEEEPLPFQERKPRRAKPPPPPPSAPKAASASRPLAEHVMSTQSFGQQQSFFSSPANPTVPLDFEDMSYLSHHVKDQPEPPSLYGQTSTSESEEEEHVDSEDMASTSEEDIDGGDQDTQDEGVIEEQEPHPEEENVNNEEQHDGNGNEEEEEEDLADTHETPMKHTRADHGADTDSMEDVDEQKQNLFGSDDNEESHEDPSSEQDDKDSGDGSDAKIDEHIQGDEKEEEGEEEEEEEEEEGDEDNVSTSSAPVWQCISAVSEDDLEVQCPNKVALKESHLHCRSHADAYDSLVLDMQNHCRVVQEFLGKYKFFEAEHFKDTCPTLDSLFYQLPLDKKAKKKIARKLDRHLSSCIRLRTKAILYYLAFADTLPEDVAMEEKRKVKRQLTIHGRYRHFLRQCEHFIKDLARLAQRKDE